MDIESNYSDFVDTKVGTMRINSSAQFAVPSSEAITWLGQVIHERINPDLTLSLDAAANRWKLTCAGTDTTITLPLISELYQLGYNAELSCSSLDITAQGFEAIEPNLPAPGLTEAPRPLLTCSEAGLHLHYDIPGLTYWMLARCEEVNPPAELLDNHLRFPATASHAFRHGYLERPIVDEWLGILRQLISRLWPRLTLVQSQFRVVVSHDVDRPSAYACGRKRQVLQAMAGDLIKRRNLKQALLAPWIRRQSRQYLHPNDRFNTFDWLMNKSEEAGIISSFYFMCAPAGHWDTRYNPEHPAIRNLMHRIYVRGHEIGLHPSYDTYDHPLRIVDEAKRLRRICKEEKLDQPYWGGRMHYLRWQWPTTAYGWEYAGFSYDSTLGYADQPGFRCGTCHEYPMFDPVMQRTLSLRQRPLIVMEGSILSRYHLEPNTSHAVTVLLQLLRQRCQTVDGAFTFLWHNSSLDHPKDQELFQSLIAPAK